ncbi:hypothetical protein L1049_001384 [Liquidambar formosana]|uniref:FBD domain-containing protein n=1 Tax=Liquidambar formosana TaxID=63359 RepID=A0AAP0R484_LIQFO
MYQDTIPNIYDFEEHSYWESQTLPYHCLQNCLKKVEIKCFMGKSNEMQMVQFLLKSASVLENFAIYSIKPKTFIPRTLHEQINFMWFQDYNFRKLLNFPRASSQAKIQIFRAVNAKFNRMY